jgi:hypothetical protein
MNQQAAVGVTVKSGWACAVLLAGPASSPRVVDSRRVELSDPAVPDARQPYHDGFGTARAAGPDLSRLVTSVERFGGRSVARVFDDYRAAGHDLRGIGIVVGSLVDPETLGNSHVRIHALEGRLFRSVVAGTAEHNGLRCSIWRERDLYAKAAGVLGTREEGLRGTVTAFGKAVTGPWRAEQKAAALAAWIVLGTR